MPTSRAMSPGRPTQAIFLSSGGAAWGLGQGIIAGIILTFLPLIPFVGYFFAGSASPNAVGRFVARLRDYGVERITIIHVMSILGLIIGALAGGVQACRESRDRRETAA